ncbi:MAG: hypothetical protein H6858_01270 [Rhodospirillales bacterium]|nr:hypothetical protein [Alphaproteobacteria bacterium]MCB1841056.1 hypothetical protein [Alphaproteobacteria bacterium]MCB9976211.1 hypothetical protein [Rhodospirillales bacterium]
MSDTPGFSHTQQNRALAIDINAAIRDMIDTAERLQTVYEEETVILSQRDGRAFLEYQDRKADAARAYQAAIGTLILRKEEIKGADPALKEKLKETQERFSKVIHLNLEHLDRMRRCTEKLSSSIRNAAIRAAQEKGTFSYSDNGRLNVSSQNRRVSTGISETA